MSAPASRRDIRTRWWTYARLRAVGDSPADARAVMRLLGKWTYLFGYGGGRVGRRSRLLALQARRRLDRRESRARA